MAVFVSCKSASRKKVLRVATASNAQYALMDIANAYQIDHNVEVEIISTSSGKLTAQIMQGAPYDIFISADSNYPRSLFEQQMCNEPKVYALGQLVIWTMDNQLVLNDSIFCNDQWDQFSIANPKTAPYGKACMEAINYYNCKLDTTKLIIGENISQSSLLIRQSAVPFGFSAVSIVNSPQNKGIGQWIFVPKHTYQAIEQSVVVLNNSQHPNSDDFFNYLFSPKAQKILRNYAYRIPK